MTVAGPLTLTRTPASGQVTDATLGLIDETFGYDTFGALAEHTARVGDAVLFREAFTRDALGRIASATETTPTGGTTTLSYVYDADGRLTAVSDAVGARLAATWDPNGNRLTVTDDRGTLASVSDIRDRLVTHGDSTYTYGPDGELTAVSTAAGDHTTYAYDALGQLVETTLADGTVVAYTRFLGQRLTRSVDSVVTTRYLYDDEARLVGLRDGAGALTAVFLWADATTPVAMIAGEKTYRLVTDHLGSIRLVVDAATGAIAQELTYDAFGRTLTDTAPGFQPFGFAGGLVDVDARLVELVHRSYDPATGRFTSRDPLLLGASSTNLYAYVDGDPVNAVDPLGLDAADDSVATFMDSWGGIAGAKDAMELVKWLRAPAIAGAGVTAGATPVGIYCSAAGTGPLVVAGAGAFGLGLYTGYMTDKLATKLNGGTRLGDSLAKAHYERQLAKQKHLDKLMLDAHKRQKADAKIAIPKNRNLMKGLR
jgi:RHS repeat-associated protein